MHWSEKIASRLIDNHPGQQTFVCASGISPSGHIHIGNFREIVTTYFVSRALEKAGKQVRFIFSWDDFDRFRKVPVQVDPSFGQYIGRPYTQVPCPYGCHTSYAEHFEQEFEEALQAFGIRPEFIYQSKEYQSRRYAPGILHALRSRGEIYDILMSFKTGKASEADRAAFYPVSIYCADCGRDSTTVHSFEEEKALLTYSCACGHHSSLSVPEADNIKLQWKIDWPMRWNMEQVLFEPGGRDHSSETGSYNVASVISERIFGKAPPMYEPYEFIRIKGSFAKMSSSSGNNYTPDDLLKVYAPENILFLFAKYQPGAAFHIGMDEDVLRNYTEYERYRKAYDSHTLTDDLRAAVELSLIDPMDDNTPGFGPVAGLLPLIHFDRQLLLEIMTRNGEKVDVKRLEQTAERAEYWVKHWMPQKLVTVNTRRDDARYETLEAHERGWLDAFCRLLRAGGMEDEPLMTEIYAICYDEDKKRMKNNQKRLFTLIYQLVLGRETGPRIPVLIQAVGMEKLLALLDF
ncbi:lysine--tRNA ligase [Paenibacillus graminis]|uniref:Lysine--tRNA ligase n=1 Tax=Paenibacillus graminis TaxID=189425 RepID=A0A089MBP8_9BACL|nr:lysine--tRNA ligase [Paenibacillus graminis]AIQ68873.1 lysyl-tRNA synthetase [Paenibacillus graminis]